MMQPFAERRTFAAADDFRALPLWGGTLVLWAYTASIYAYKTWYIAAAAALAATLIVAGAGALCTRGLLRSLLPTLAYYVTLVASIVWAVKPDFVIEWVAIDSIEIVIFILFFLVGRNSAPRAFMAAIMTVIIPAILVAVVMYGADPNASRLAVLALPLLPAVLAFAWAYLSVATKHRWPAVLTIVISFAILLAGRSRTPLVASLAVTALAIVVFRRNILQLVRRTIAGAIAAAVIVGVLLAIPATRPMVVTTYVRLSYTDVVWDDLYVPAEARDQERDNINDLSVELARERFPRGIGYMNFLWYYEQRFGVEANIHNTFVTWVVEGGLPAVVAALWILGAHFGALRRFTRRAATRDVRAYGQAIGLATIGVLLMGAFHQVHQTPALWMLFGLGGACRAEEREAR